MDIWTFIDEQIKLQQTIILMIVIDNQGSSPGKKGFKMAVSKDGQLFGSIGGGIMERDMVEEARRMIEAEDFKIIIKTKDHNTEEIKGKSKDLDRGSQTIAFYPITQEISNAFVEIISKIRKKKAGSVRYSESGIRYLENWMQERKYQYNYTNNKDWEFIEQIGIVNKLYIFGAGHVSLVLSRVCSFLDFEIHLFDDRQELNTYETNTWAISKQIIDYSDVKNIALEEKHSFVVIMSHTHQSDELILSQLLSKRLLYLAMIGSKKKVHKIKTNLLAKGFSEEQLSELHSPIGIPINSQTPEEIAISIAAEMIKVKNQ